MCPIKDYISQPVLHLGVANEVEIPLTGLTQLWGGTSLAPLNWPLELNYRTGSAQ